MEPPTKVTLGVLQLMVPPVAFTLGAVIFWAIVRSLVVVQPMSEVEKKKLQEKEEAKKKEDEARKTLKRKKIEAKESKGRIKIIKKKRLLRSRR